jgi:DNA topoisomerase I
MGGGRSGSADSGHSGFVTDAAVATLSELLADTERCAAIAGLRYVETAEPGFSRRRRGRGFSYVDAAGSVVDVETRERIRLLVIPPAWRQVWICTDPEAHLLATGVDDRGRRQYLYHPRWREARDVINAYRLIEVGPRLPAVRAEVERQLRRRTLDRAVVLAAMVRTVDKVGIRVGNEVYAEENDSVGLCTLTKRHVSVDRGRVRLRFPAKAGLAADLTLDDADVARIVQALLARPGRRLFALDGRAVTPDELNRHLAGVTDGVVTAKDFRTWRGTRAAFEVLRRPGGADREQRAIEAVDAAAILLACDSGRAWSSVARRRPVWPSLTTSWPD